MFGTAEHDPAEDIKVVQQKLRNGGFDVPITGELDECTCGALRLVGGPQDLINDCGNMGWNCADKKISALLKKGKVKAEPKAKVAKEEPQPELGDTWQPYITPEVKKIGFLLAASAASVFGLYCMGRKHAAARAETQYQDVGLQVEDAPFKEIKGEKVDFTYEPQKLLTETTQEHTL